MRIPIVICALLLLTSCGKPIGMLGGGADSSPVIIADDSIHIRRAKNDNFNLPVIWIFSKKHAAVKQAKFEPYALGYQCDPSYDANACKRDCAVKVESGCALRLPDSLTDWTLNLCDTKSPCASARVKITWQVLHHDNAEEVDIDSQDDDLNVKTTNGFPDLYHTSAKTLASATLAVNGKTYDFDCPKGVPCLYLSYECHVSGNTKCR